MEQLLLCVHACRTKITVPWPTGRRLVILVALSLTDYMAGCGCKNSRAFSGSNQWEGL